MNTRVRGNHASGLRDYYYVQSEKLMSDGNPPNGFAKGFFWQHGFSGPHPKREAERIMSVVGGVLVSCEEAEAAIDAIDNPSKASKRSAKPKFQADVLTEADAEMIEEASEVEVADESEELPTYEEVGYNTAVKLMREAGFDFAAVGGGKKSAQVEKAWNVFRKQS